MFESGVLSRGHWSSCFWVGTLFPKSLSVSMWILGPDHLSDCQFAQWHILSQTSAGGRDNKNKRSRHFILSLIRLSFYFFIYLFFVLSECSKRRMQLSFMKCRKAAVDSVRICLGFRTWGPLVHVIDEHARCFFICFIWPGFTLSLHHSSDLLIFFISKYFDNLLNRWGKCFASLKKEV